MELTVTNRSKAYPEKREDADEENSSASAEAGFVRESEFNIQF